MANARKIGNIECWTDVRIANVSQGSDLPDLLSSPKSSVRVRIMFRRLVLILRVICTFITPQNRSWRALPNY